MFEIPCIKHPLPVMRMPKVDHFMMHHIKQRYPKSCDAELGTMQAAHLSAATPLTHVCGLTSG